MNWIKTRIEKTLYSRSPQSPKHLRAPQLIYTHGNVPDEKLFAAIVAIIGTRNASRESMAWTHHAAGILGTNKVLVASGGALGIDTAAHKGALCVGAPSLCFLPGGLKEPYPAQNKPLFLSLTLVAEHENVKLMNYMFLRRNLLLAAAVDAVIVVEAPKQSGTLSTANHAMKLGKKCFVLPRAPWDVRGEGNLDLLSNGAILLRNVEELNAHFNLNIQKKEPLNVQHTPESRILRLLKETPLAIDELSEALSHSCCIELREIKTMLVKMQMRAQVSVTPDGRYVAL